MRRLITLLLLLPALAIGQGALSRMELGLNGGGMNYLGDLNNQSMLGRLNWGYGAFFRYNLDERWAVTAGGARGQIEGGNPRGLEGVRGDWDPRRNLSFLSPVTEATLRVEFNFLPYGMEGQMHKVSPFIFAGVGLFGFNPKALYTNPLTGETAWHALQPLGTEGQGTPDYGNRRPYTLIQLCMPFGVGVKAKPNKLFAFSVEYGFRKTWTDYLDDCSLTYVGAELLERYHPNSASAALADRSPQPNAPGIKRGDDSLDDWYAYIAATLSLRLDRMLWWVGKKKCDNKNY